MKIPRWPFDKFNRADRILGSQMKATGEVMAIDRFEAVLSRRSGLWRSVAMVYSGENWVDDR